MRVLVTYGSKREGTAGIAARVGDCLRKAGHEADVLPAPEVDELSSYGATIVGGALYARRWHRHARRFVKRFANDLRALPVWFFSSGPLDDSADRTEIPPTAQVDRLMTLVDARGHVTFGGRLAADARGFPAAAMAKKRAGDWRNPNRIDAWGMEVARALSDLHEAAVPAARPPTPSAISTAAFVLSALALVGASVASLTTLLWSGAFPQPTAPMPINTILAEARGWSAVTLLGAVPFGAVALVAARRGSLRGRLAWTGILAYLVYTYLELAVSPPFTVLYLVYVATFACAIPALVMAVASGELPALPAWFRGAIPRRTLAAFALLCAAGLALAWLKGIVARTLRADFGWLQAEEAVGHVVHALDLGLLVPLGLATGILLLRDRPSAYLVGAIQIVVGVFMGAALTGMVAVSAVASGQSVLAAGPFAVLGLGWLVLAIGFFRSVRPIRATTRLLWLW